MLRDERINDPVNTMQAILQGWQVGIWTALPATVTRFDATKITVEAQPTIQAQVRAADGTLSWVTLPVCPDCPILFPGNHRFGLTFPLAAGDEGLLVFASRCIDNWWYQGGVRTQAELRMHNLSDGIFIPGLFSQKNLPGSVPATGARLRKNDDSIYVEIQDGGIHIKGTVTVEGDVVANGISLVTHVHGGVQVGGGNTGVPHA